MAKPAPLSDDELKALANHELRQAVGYFGGKLADQRKKAEVYYLGLPEGDLAPPEIDGRSSVVSTDVRNTIESMLPQLMAKFVGGDQVVEFEPAQRDDEQKASQCTDYLNYLFSKKNNGHAVCYSWFKDALLQKNGFIKVWWDTRAEEKREDYKGLTDVELAEILDDPEVEPIEQDSYPDEEDAKHREEAIAQLTQQMQGAMQAAQQGDPKAQQAVMGMQQQLAQIQAQPVKMLYDVSFKRSLKGGKLAIANVPPEEFLISREAKTIPTARMVGHRVPRTLSELRSMGYKNVDNIGSDDAAASLNAERVTRLGFDDEFASLGLENAGDDSQRTVWLNELYIRCDYDGDGIAELRKVVIAGNELLDNEEVDVAPFISITPVPMPHKFFGLSIADLGMETQKVKTNTLRAMQDNMFLQVNGRYFAVNGKVNLDDLLTSRPGGIVRVDDPGAVGRLDQGMGDMASASNMLEFLEMDLEQRTGWTRYSQGNDSKALNQTATGVQIITNKGDMRVDLIARNFAEGFVELFRMMLKLVTQHQDKKTQVRIAGQWIDLDPREWRNQFDVNVNVGLGIGSKDEQIQKLMALSQNQAHGMAIGVSTPKNVYNLFADVAKAMGQKDPDKYFTDPEKAPPKPPKPDPEAMKLQGQMQLEQAKLQADAQKFQAQAALDAQKVQFEAQAKLQEQQAALELQAANDQRDAERELMKAQYQAQLDNTKLELERWKAELESQRHAADTQAKLAIAHLQSETQLQIAGQNTAVKVNDTQTKAAVTQSTAEMGAQTTRDTAQMSADTAKEAAKAKSLPMKEKPAAAPPAPAPAPEPTDLSPVLKKLDELIKHVNTPPEVVRDKDGKATHVKRGDTVRAINRDDNGRISGY